MAGSADRFGAASLTRREFGKAAGAAGLVAAAGTAGLARPAIAQAKAKLVVVGGGAGGATVAKYVAKDNPNIAVTLVEPQRAYTSCFFSNWFIGGYRSFESITYGYDALRRKYGIAVLHDRAAAIDPAAKTVRLHGGGKLDYDRLVVAPGIEIRYDRIDGYNEAAAKVMPHAWRGGAQAYLLRRQLLDMPDGGTVIIAPPDNPYRCPPGPYERASLIAHYLKAYKPRSKVLILDAKGKFAKQRLFEDGWARFYPGLIEWLPTEMTGGGVHAVDAKGMRVKTDDEWFPAAVANVIPPQRAGKIAQAAGLANDTGWCPVNPATLESVFQPDIHLVGDAIIPGDMAKSAFAANSQAKVCAMAIRAALSGAKAPPPRFLNTCWSLIATNHAVKVGGTYQATGNRIESTDSFISQPDETDQVRAETAIEAKNWYAEFTEDVFG
jgi:sulfide dehydrogenase [flavocytochrome c] flavoprotein subunit